MIGRVRALVLCAVLSAGLAAQEPLKYMGRTVTITDPGAEDKEGMFPKGPATVCIEGSPRQCFTMPDKFGNHPQAEVVEIGRGVPALFFTAEGGGVSGWNVHFALLRPGQGTYVPDLLDVSASNLGQHAFWDEAPISDAKIFVTADYQWGPNEAHYGPHRYIISSYLYLPSTIVDRESYYLEDRYMTIKRYDDEVDVLAAEKQEILARLAKVKQQGAALR